MPARAVADNDRFLPFAHDHYDGRVKRSPRGIHAVIPVARDAKLPLHRQLYNGYRDAIVEGRLGPGERLPSTRALADELGLSRIPVVGAFEQLLAEGYLESRVGAGTFVARVLPDVGPRTPGRPGPVRPGRRPVAAGPMRLVTAPEPWLAGRGAFRVSQPAVDAFPLALWARLSARHARSSSPRQLEYGDPMGQRPFREVLAGYLGAARAVRCDAEQIMVVSGSQQALELSARVLLEPRSPVWVEEPGYSGARDVLTMAGADLVPVPVDDEGLDVAAGVRLASNARAAYVTPSHQYPLGATLSAPRRLALLDWARRSGAWILEDDYDSEYRYGSPPIAALQGLDRDDRVIYIGTFSKVLFPALRVGYLVVPRDLVPRFARVRDAVDLFPPTQNQAVLTEFIADGHYARHLRRMRLLYRERRSALVAALSEELGDVGVHGAEAGMHLVVTLPPGVRDRAVAIRAAEAGLWVMPLSETYIGARKRHGFVLGFGATDASQMREKVRLLASLLPRQNHF
jgi:GntR family transcriptional regulator/MocR family aminotransferase